MIKQLTARERDILRLLIVDGPSNIEIGQQLFLSEKTIKFHISSAMRKIGARNRTHLALLVATALFRCPVCGQSSLPSLPEGGKLQ